jgi:hypothetical protein
VTTLGLFRGVVRDALGHLNAAPDVDPTQTFYRRNLSRIGLDDKADALTTQVMTSVPIYLQAGDTVTNLTFVSGATAVNTPTNYWFALYGPGATPALLAQTADQTNAAWAADTAKTLALAAPVKITVSGVYYAAIMVKATGVPSLIGTLGAKPVVTGETNLAQTSGAALTTTAPATITAAAVQRAVPLVIAT